MQVCDCYDALRTRRFHRGAWTPESALKYVEDKAGTVFDTDIAKAFVTMMRRWERRIIPIEEGQPLQARPANERDAGAGARVAHDPQGKSDRPDLIGRIGRIDWPRAFCP